MHYFLIAGEPSGDLHASHLITAIKEHDPSSCFTFLGGDKMALAAGTEPVIHYRHMAFMGFSEVLRNLGTIKQNFGAARRAFAQARPDCLILVDYPSFNLKMAEYAHKLGIPAYYYIPPKIWAWKSWRVKDIRRYIRRVFSILPFEPEWYKAHGAEAVYAGNPSVTETDRDMATALPKKEFFELHGLDASKPLVALMPGSRKSEIRNNLPIMLHAGALVPGVQVAIIGAPNIPDALYRRFATSSTTLLRPENAAQVLVHARAALVTSGTATLEAALTATPQVVLYRANGSRISYHLMKAVLSIHHVSLPNLIAGRTIIPEMLLHHCTPQKVAAQLAPLLHEDSDQRKAQLQGYAQVREALGTADCGHQAAVAIIGDLKAGTTAQ